MSQDGQCLRETVREGDYQIDMGGRVTVMGGLAEGDEGGK